MEVKIANEEAHQGDQDVLRVPLGLKPSVLRPVQTWEVEVEDHRLDRRMVRGEVSWVLQVEVRGGEEGSSFVLLVVLNREIHDRQLRLWKDHRREQQGR